MRLYYLLNVIVHRFVNAGRVNDTNQIRKDECSQQARPSLFRRPLSLASRAERDRASLVSFFFWRVVQCAYRKQSVPNVPTTQDKILTVFIVKLQVFELTNVLCAYFGLYSDSHECTIM